MIRCLTSSFQRWSIRSPARLTTPSTPSKAAGSGRSSVGSQRCQVTRGLEERERAGSRLRPTTSSPRAKRASHRAVPIVPLAPVTRIRIVSALALDRREGPGLLVEAGDAVALGLLDHRFGDFRGDLAVEDAGDDVVLGEI